MSRNNYSLFLTPRVANLIAFVILQTCISIIYRCISGCCVDRFRKQPEHQYESVPSVEATKLLGLPQNGKESPKVECEYAVVNKQRKKACSSSMITIIVFLAMLFASRVLGSAPLARRLKTMVGFFGAVKTGKDELYQGKKIFLSGLLHPRNIR